MGLRLANEMDCTLFAFWHETKIYQGINCQGELFVTLATFPIQRQGDAYNCASEVDSGLGAALVLLTKTKIYRGSRPQPSGVANLCLGCVPYWG